MGSKNQHRCVACHKQAAVFISYIKEGTVVCDYYCSKHASHKGLLSPIGYAFLDDGYAVKRASSASQTCICGVQQWQLKRTTRLGCPHCYHTFHSFLLNVITKVHQRSQHRGKVPLKYQCSQQYTTKIKNLNKEMALAISEERYEDAAALRDDIAVIRQRLIDDSS